MQKPVLPLILLTNDDGFDSPYLMALAKALCSVCDLYMLAPNGEQSGVGHAFTHRKALKLFRLDYDFEAYSITGTPADCVKFAVTELFKEQSFDLVISGVNVGENAGVSSIYSGTVAAAREAALWKLPAVAISLEAKSDFMLSIAIDFALSMVQNKLYLEIPENTFWNLNFPNACSNTYQGIAVTSMGLDMFIDFYKNKDDLWHLEGYKDYSKAKKGSDDHALHHSFASLTPLSLCSTNHVELLRLHSLFDSSLAKG